MKLNLKGVIAGKYAVRISLSRATCRPGTTFRAVCNERAACSVRLSSSLCTTTIKRWLMSSVNASSAYCRAGSRTLSGFKSLRFVSICTACGLITTNSTPASRVAMKHSRRKNDIIVDQNASKRAGESRTRHQFVLPEYSVSHCSQAFRLPSKLYSSI